jgi:HJR/Mrr/RecB family endonuclease
MKSFGGEYEEVGSRQSQGEPEIVTANRVLDAQAESTRAAEHLQTFQHQLTTILASKKILMEKRAYFAGIKRIRQFGDDTITRPGLLVVGTVGAGGIALILGHLVGLRIDFSMMALLLAVSLMCLRGAKLFNPPDATLASQIDALNVHLHSAEGEQSRVQAEIAKASYVYHALLTKYQSILDQFNSRINSLRTTNWEILQGVPFEQFLASIFVEWGYEVETTKVTGDQGVDLIITKRGLRVAVQAKGYPGSTVGNSAIQEADTGMRFYRCHRSAVITNSTFTAAARKLAEGVGCTLIDHGMIPLLIEGKVNL